MMPLRHPYIIELLEDIDTGKILPLTTVKNITGILEEFVSQYNDYDVMIKDLKDWNYIKYD